PPPPPVMPGAFDFQRNAFFAGIGATGVMIGAPTRIAGAGAGWGTAIADLRARAAHRIADRLPGPATRLPFPAPPPAASRANAGA
ncbi:MAG: hypothetical protein VXY81_12180, partial [Pseudomonadota bacterium]|nr:hypothetical protein [Pseudomonadota bacterium]